MLMALSGHTSVRSLGKYARVSAQALARWLAETESGQSAVTSSEFCHRWANETYAAAAESGVGTLPDADTFHLRAGDVPRCRAKRPPELSRTYAGTS